MKTFRHFAIPLFPLVALVLSACSTVESRIAKNPAVFNALPEKQKDLVRDEKIAEGLSRDAVVLAWGRPDEVETGTQRGKKMETWTWLATYEAPDPNFYGAAWFASPYWGYYPMSRPATRIHTYPIRESIFENGRVVAWRSRVH